MKKRSLWIASILFVCATQLVQSTLLPAQTWTVMKPMPTARTGPMAAAVGKDIYVFGGVSQGRLNQVVVNMTEAYNTSTDIWKSCAPMPTLRVSGAAEAVGDKIYVIGGFNTVDAALGVVEIYNPATNTWSKGSPMPTPRSEIFSCVIDDKIYITGGWPSAYSQLEIYDPATDSWSSGSSCPSGILQHNSGVGCNGEFYVLGGKDYLGATFYKSNYVYNPAEDSWNFKSEMPEQLFAGDAEVLDGKIHYFGGSRKNVPTVNFDCHYIYNPATDDWSTGLSLLEKRADHVAVTVDNSTYLIGGRLSCPSCDSITNLNERYTEHGLDLSKVRNPNSLNIYPVPAKNNIVIEMKDGLGELKSLKIVDITGRKHLIDNFRADRITIDISGYPSGVYLVVIGTSKGTVCQNVVVSR